MGFKLDDVRFHKGILTCEYGFLQTPTGKYENMADVWQILIGDL